ncbi:uncharacterized protein LOC117333582 [Pecten maximus]|uniref:uncharacterized protein LOC117333582 n=1 Tax=Pecten maximus TaxID=6579 RepID=UPI00145918A3|nr:uncharacterized protein LOC117333582 [Pecten maximus]
MQKLQYLKLPWKRCHEYVMRVDSMWKAALRCLHTPARTTPCISHMCSVVSLQHKQSYSVQGPECKPYSVHGPVCKRYHVQECELNVSKSKKEYEAIQRPLFNLAESMYQKRIRNHPWLYPYSRFVAFSQKQNTGILEDLEIVETSPELEYLIETTMDLLGHIHIDNLSSLFLDFTHAGLAKTHPLMTNLFLQLQSRRKSLDFVSLGQYLSTIVNYNGSHILIITEILPQLRHLLQNGFVRIEQNPNQYLHTLCQFSSHGLLQQLDNAVVSDLLFQISSLCSDQESIENDFDLIIPVFELVSLFMLGDEGLTFIEPSIKDTCEKILKIITGKMLENIEDLNLHQLCAIMAMSAEEQMEFLSKPFLEKVQSRTECILFEMQNFSSYNILELHRLANLSWVRLSAKSRDRLLNLTLEYLQEYVKEESFPPEMVIFLKCSKAFSDMLLDRKIPLSAKQSLKQAILDVNIWEHLEFNDFIAIYETISMYFLSTEVKDEFTHKCQTELLTNPFLSVRDKLRRLFVLLLKKETDPRILKKVINEQAIYQSNLDDVKQIIQLAALTSKGNFYNDVVKEFSKMFCLVGRKRLQTQTDFRTLFLLGSGRIHMNPCNYKKLCGMPSWRLQEQFSDLNNPTGDLDQDILNVLTFLCHRDLDLPEFEMACLMVLQLPSSPLPLLYNSLLNYAITNQSNMKANHFRDLLQILVSVGRVGRNTDTFIQRTIDFINQLTLDAIDPPILIQMLCSMSELKVFSQDIITEVFQPSYLNKLTELLHSPDLSYNQSALLMNNIVQLNRAVCLKCPEYGVPYLQDLVESRLPEPVAKSDDVRDKFVLHSYKQCLLDLFTTEFGGPEFINTDHITSAGLHIDIAVYFDENLDVVEYSQLDHMEKAGKHYKKVAVLCLDKNNFNSVSKGVRAEVEQRVELLEAQGYNVILASCRFRKRPKMMMEMASHVLSEIYDSVGKTIKE